MKVLRGGEGASRGHVFQGARSVKIYSGYTNLKSSWGELFLWEANSVPLTVAVYNVLTEVYFSTLKRTHALLSSDSTWVVADAFK